MQSVNIANIFIMDYGKQLQLTNLKLNKLVYFTQVEALRNNHNPVFSDCIEAWEYGPVEPGVYKTFRDYGRKIITQPSDTVIRDANAEEIIRIVTATYGKLSAFDLVNVSHRDGGAWKKRYVFGKNNEITISDIINSIDIEGFNSIGETSSQKINRIKNSIPNTLRLLQNS